MSFFFDNSNQSAFNTNTAKPTGFGAPFGLSTPATTTATDFGLNSTFGQSTFGQQPTSQFGSSFKFNNPTPAFGSNTQSIFGTSGFGTTPASTAFGTGAAVTSTSGLFGTASKPSLFNAPTTSAPLFSSSAPLFNTNTQPSNLFGSNLFGTTTSAPTLFGNTSFGTTTTNSGLFANTGGGGGGGGFSLFGQTTSAPTLFTNSNFGTQSGFGFGTPNTAFGAKQAQPQHASPPQQNQLIITSIYSINIFNDERDDILKKWNLLQACWGTGKGYYNPNMPPVEYNHFNPFYRFKAISYNVIPEYDNSEGLVKLVFNKKYSELSNQKTTLANGIAGILGNKPNLKVSVESIKAINELYTEVRIVVTEKGVTGNPRNITAIDLANYLNQPVQKQQLTNVGVLQINPLVTPSKAMLEEYFKTVPSGFDQQMWKAAIADNPNPNKYMPVPIYGFNDLKSRKMMQEHETGLHKAYEVQISKELKELKTKHAASIAKINEFKQRFLQLQHRTLTILVRQESIRKTGLALQPEEEYLKGKLETMHSQLNVPTQFKGKLNELISSVKLMERTARPLLPQYTLIPESQVELKKFLHLQQTGISTLVDIVKEDMKNLNVILEGTRQIVHNKNTML